MYAVLRHGERYPFDGHSDFDVAIGASDEVLQCVDVDVVL